jgi:hypothetical protein
MDRFDEDPPPRRHLLDRLQELLMATPFEPVRLRTSDGSAWELRGREALVETAGRSILRCTARRAGAERWSDVEIRAAALVSIEVDSALHGLDPDSAAAGSTP